MMYKISRPGFKHIIIREIKKFLKTKQYRPILYKHEADNLLKPKVTSAICIGKLVQREVPIMEAVMDDTRNLE